MSFFRAISNGFSNYFSFAGIASRTQFWFWVLFVTIILCVALIVDGAILGPMWSSAMGAEGVMPFDQDAGKPLTVTLLALLVVPTITIAGRRLQDSGYSARWLLIALTGIGLLPLVFFLLKKGRKEANPFAR